MTTPASRILTTHVGSLPRPQAVVDQLFAEDRGEAIDRAAYDATMRAAVADAVADQIDPRRHLHPPPPDRLRAGRGAARHAQRPG
jgi:hypothetical protein